MPGKIRPARGSDLDAVYEVWFEATHPGRPGAGPPPDVVLPLFRHELTTGHLWVAEDGDGLVGYAASFVRGGVLFLADLHIVPARQSHGLGGALLDQVLAYPAATRYTMSSLDPRAVALYARAGMRPRWPHLLLAADAPDLAALPGADLAVATAEAGDPAFLEWDARVGGRPRPEDHAFLREIGAVPLWYARGGARVGYGYAWIRARAEAGPEVRLGPLGAASRTDAVACVGAALRWAADAAAAADRAAGPRAWTYRVSLPAPHAALEPLLGAGFHLSGMEIFCCSRARLFCDPRAYLALAGSEGTSIF